MKGSMKIISLMAVISLFLGVIWLPLSFAATVPTFADLGSLGTKGVTGDYSNPIGIAMDAAGKFYVTDGNPMVSPGADRIVIFDAAGNNIDQITGLDLSGPIAVKGDGSEIYVALGQLSGGPGTGPGVDGVAVINVATGAQRFVGTAAGADGRGEFKNVSGLELDASGWLYVADSGFGAIKVYDAAGAYSYQIGAPCYGNGATNACEAGEFMSLVSFALDAGNDQLFVSDRSSLAYSPDGTIDTGNVQVFTLSTRAYKGVLFADQMGGKANATESFENYYGLTVDGQRLYLACSAAVLRGLDAAVVNPGDAYLASYDLGSGATNGAVYDSTNKRLVLSGDYGVVIVGVDGGSNPTTQNDAPPVPALSAPVANTIIATNSPTLTFAAVTDPNGDAVSYQVSLAQVGQAAVVSNVPAGATSFATSGLVENAQYSWKVQAIDAKGAASGWSAAGEFWVNAVNESPTVPQLVSPLNGEQLGPYGSLDWSAATDPDPGNRIRYRLSLSPAADFSGSVLTEFRWGTSAPLQALKNYLEVVAGSTCFWRVEALDGKGGWSSPSLSGSFVLNATDLRVDTNMPGTRVYLAGSHASVGQYLGVTPLVVRNPQPAGMNELVFERAGFETRVKTLYVKPGAARSLSYAMTPALTPANGTVSGYSFFYRAQNAAGQLANTYLGNQDKSLRSAFVANLDRHKDDDLISVDQNGAVVLFADLRPVVWAGKEIYRVEPPQSVLPAGSAVSVFAVDWKNKGRIDLLVGTSNGKLKIYRNSSRNAVMFDTAPAVLQANGQDLVFSANPVPVVLDWDGDGLNDILVGDDSGALNFVKNIGTATQPVLAAPVVVFQSTLPVAPCLSDWDGDGVKEMLLIDAKGLSVYELGVGGLTYANTLSLMHSDGRKFAAKANTRMFAFDIDGTGGKDLVISDGLGRFLVSKSNGTQYVPSFQSALIVKVDQVQTLVDAQIPSQSTQVGAVRSAIQNSDYVAANLEVDNLLAGLDPIGSAYAAASELKLLLQ